MYIVEVIPLISLPPQAPQILSYFSDRTLPVGSVAEAPIGKRKLTAVIISCRDVEQAKINIKRAGFELKKIGEVLSENPQVNSRQLKITSWLARTYYASLGLTLKTVLPPFFGVKKYELSLDSNRQFTTNGTKQNKQQKPVLLLTKAKDTISNIRPYVHDALKDDSQILILVPEVAVARYFAENLSESHPVALLSSSLPNTSYHDIWQSVSEGSLQIIVATRAGLFLPFKNLQTIVVEDASNEAYKSDIAPRYLATDLAKMIAQICGAQIILTAPLPNIAQYNQINSKTIALIDRAKHRKTDIIVADAVAEMKTGNFSMFSRQLQEQLLNSIIHKNKILLFSARKAFAGILVCKNCGAIKKCPNCDIPMRAYKTPSTLPGGSERMLICYHCSTYFTPPDACPNCRSNQLSAAGIAGSQKIQEALLAFIERAGASIPDEIRDNLKTFIFDSDLVRNQDQEDEMLKKIDAAPFAIVIATHLVLSHRYRRRFELIAIPNADGLTSARDFRTEERFLNTFEQLLDFQPERLVVQTYNPQSRALLAAIHGDYENFYDAELEARRAMNYPPFSRLVKLAYRHKNAARAALAARALSEKLKMVLHQLELATHVQILGPSPASIAKENNFYTYNIILKVSPKLERLDSILKFVPSDWLIDVDPKNLV